MNEESIKKQIDQVNQEIAQLQTECEHIRLLIKQEVATHASAFTSTRERLVSRLHATLESKPFIPNTLSVQAEVQFKDTLTDIESANKTLQGKV